MKAIIYKEFGWLSEESELHCSGDYQPEEKEERDYPGCAENYDNIQVKLKMFDGSLIDITGGLDDKQEAEIIEEMLEMRLSAAIDTMEACADHKMMLDKEESM